MVTAEVALEAFSGGMDLEFGFPAHVAHLYAHEVHPLVSRSALVLQRRLPVDPDSVTPESGWTEIVCVDPLALELVRLVTFAD